MKGCRENDADSPLGPGHQKNRGEGEGGDRRGRINYNFCRRGGGGEEESRGEENRRNEG